MFANVITFILRFIFITLNKLTISTWVSAALQIVMFINSGKELNISLLIIIIGIYKPSVKVLEHLNILEIGSN